MDKDKEKTKNDKGKTIFRKQIWNRSLRCAAIAAGLLLFAGGCLLAASNGQQVRETLTQTLFNYKIQAGMEYRVHLIPNELYEEEWMEPGRIYSAPLTDYIEVTAKTSLIGAGEAAVDGDYRLRMVLEGYQTSSAGRQVIYHKEFPLRAGTLTNKNKLRPETAEILQIDRNEYNHYVEKAESILGEPTPKELFLQMDGSYNIAVQDKKVTRSFSSRLPIPLGNSNFYEIVQPDPFHDEGAVTTENAVYIRKNQFFFFLSAASAGGGLLLSLFTLFATRLPDTIEAWKSLMHRLMRRHGSRILCLENMPELDSLEQVYLKNLEALIVLSEELRRPVFCSLDEEQLPRYGRFCVLGDERVYLFERQCPTTTLVEEKIENRAS